MKKYLDVLVDVETLSLRSTAAIIQIAAKTFMLNGCKTKKVTDEKKLENQFIKNVNATTCAMYGMSFDQSTVEWWSKQEAKEDFKVEWGEPISYVLSEFNEWLEQWQRDSKADELMIWTQGTDFDIAVLRNAYRVVFGDEKSIPWHFRNVRDARTYFLETARVLEPNVEDPYSLIETKGTVHNALADCEWSIKAVQWAYEKYNKKADAPSADEEENTREKRIKPAIADGVYFVEDGCKPVRFADAVCVQSPKYCNVMVNYHGHKWIVAKEDLKGEELPLFSDDSHPEDTSSFYKCEIEALNDFDMKSCTEHLRQTGIAFELDADLYIPTAGQLAAMYLYRKELHKALEMVGGTPMKEEIYWSSSEGFAWRSWYVNFRYGIAWYEVKSYDNYVRPCSAFEL